MTNDLVPGDSLSGGDIKDANRQVALLEALLFASGHPLKVSDITEIMEISEEAAQELLRQYQELLAETNRGLELFYSQAGWELVTKPDFAPFLEKLYRRVVATPLSQAALETLAIVAYNQPVTRAEIDSIRGVNSQTALSTLLERQLIHEVGRKDAPGRPILYGTTDLFLRELGVASLEDLPPLPRK